MNIERAPASRSGFFARWTVACGTGEVMGIAAAATCAVVALTVIGEPSTVRERSADGLLVGFVNVAWDGCDHAFLLDTKTRGGWQHRGVGTEVVRQAAHHAKEAGCEWLHVDFEPELAPFYFDACDFRPTEAGLIHLATLD